MLREASRRLKEEQNIDIKVMEKVSETYANSANLLRRMLNEVIKYELDHNCDGPMRHLKSESDRLENLVGRKRNVGTAADYADNGAKKVKSGSGNGRGAHLQQWMKCKLTFVNDQSVCNVCHIGMKPDMIQKDVMKFGKNMNGTVKWQLRHVACHEMDKGKENRTGNSGDVIDLTEDS